MKKVTKAVAALMLMTAVVFATGCKKDNSGILDGHEYVDLGLPSGTMWATCNVGATTPEGYGDYFAWGESTTKSDYRWDTYQYCNGSSSTLTKYCNNSSYGYSGFTDNLTTLESSDDAATTNWGNGWRMPTCEEWVELYENTTNTWTTRNGVSGRLFTASSGSSLFLPAAGSHGYGGLKGVGLRGYYWSSSLNTEYIGSARSLAFNSTSAAIHDSDTRSAGFSVRPVREK